jgi:hypothetical protein
LPIAERDSDADAATERDWILAAMREVYKGGDYIPAATTGKRTAYRVLAARGGMPAALCSGRPGKERFWDHVEALRKANLVREGERRRTSDRHGVRVLEPVEDRAGHPAEVDPIGHPVEKYEEKVSALEKRVIDAEAKAEAEREAAEKRAGELAAMSAEGRAKAETAYKEAKEAAVKPPQQREEDEPDEAFAPTYEAPRVENYDEKVAALDKPIAEAEAEYKSGDKTFDEFCAEERAARPGRSGPA